MKNCYIVRLPDDRLLCLYDRKDKGIVYKSFENNRWGRETPLVPNARSHFTVTLDKNGVIYAFCQDTEGHIVLCTNGSGAWSNKIILQNQSDKIHTISLNPIITDRGLCIIYNMPSPDDKTNYIVYQKLGENGQWSLASRIDKFMPQNETLYSVQHVSDEHVLLFYQTRTSENTIGYREMTPHAQSNYYSFHTTAYQISDASFLTTDSAIHGIYILKSMFSCQLVYRKKASDHFSPPVVVWEGQSLNNCLLFFVKDNLYAMYMSGGNLYYCISDDKGETFSKPSRYKNKFCLQPLKATYLSHAKQYENQLYCRQLYVDSESVWDIQILPELFEDFYPSVRVAAQDEAKQIHETPESYDMRSDENNALNEKIFILENQMMLAQEQNKEKDDQIIQFTNLLKKRNAELHDIDSQRKYLAQKCAALEQQLAKKTEIEAGKSVVIAASAETAAKVQTVAPAEAQTQDIIEPDDSVVLNKNQTH